MTSAPRSSGRPCPVAATYPIFSWIRAMEKALPRRRLPTAPPPSGMIAPYRSRKTVLRVLQRRGISTTRRPIVLRRLRPRIRLIWRAALKVGTGRERGPVGFLAAGFHSRGVAWTTGGTMTILPRVAFHVVKAPLLAHRLQMIHFWMWFPLSRDCPRTAALGGETCRRTCETPLPASVLIWRKSGLPSRSCFWKTTTEN